MADIGQSCLRAFINAERNRTHELLQLVQQPQNLKDDDNRSLLHWAAIHGWHDICQILIEKYHLNATAKTISGYTPLHIACLFGREQVVKHLLSLPTVLPTVNDEDVGGWTALDLACANGQLPVIEMLVREPSVHMPIKRLRNSDFAILSLLSTRMEWSTVFHIRPLFRVFMAGNSAAGKTTLTTAMQSLASSIFTPPQRQQQCHGLVTGVKTLTAGVCPTPCSG